MTTKASRASTATSDEDDSMQANMPDTARQPMALAVQASASLLRAAEIVQQANLQMLQRAALNQQQAADKLRDAASAPDLMSAQSSLWMNGMVESVRYGSDLMAAAMRIQSELMGGMAPPSRASASATTSAMGTPMMQAWQNLFMAPLNAASQSMANVSASAAH